MCGSGSADSPRKPRVVCAILRLHPCFFHRFSTCKRRRSLADPTFVTVESEEWEW
jgi:hypothetical protein